ncbi:MAG: amino acid adenylation domain-containing protein [Steroidobacteraceae bacterium]
MKEGLPAAPQGAPAGGNLAGLLQHIFEDAARRWPERVAVDIPPGHDRPSRVLATYAELNVAAQALANHLRTLILGECVVGIFLPRTTPQLFSAQLAVLGAGAAYTCVDPTFPDQRVQEILEDAEVQILLTDSAGRARLQRRGVSAIEVLDVNAILATCPRKPPAGVAATTPAWLTPASLAYVVYTSGTTGRPKGVMVEHHSIVNLVESDRQIFQLAPAARVAQGSSPAYDSSVEETWLAFAAGATLVVMDDDSARLGPDLIGWLRHERISVFCPPPTQLRATGCTDPASALPELKLLYVGGEPLPRDVAERWSPGRVLVNGYGPTECTVTCLRGRVEAGQPITIGTPVDGATAWVLDEAGEEVGAGEQGELWMGGIGVARGYWKRPELTADKFITHPQRGRLYRTGDLVHRDEAGRFFYHGRIDSQVKLRGYRIELGEIESRLAELPGVRAAGCRMQTDDGGDVIVAFIVPVNPAMAPPTEQLQASLAKVLPGYMVPNRIAMLPALPTTVGGKLDRAALPRLDSAASRPQASIVAPRDPMEVRLATAFQQTLMLAQPVSIHDDFFNDLGGDSLKAALLVTLLRHQLATAWITVRDIYDARSVAALAARARPVREPEIAPLTRQSADQLVRPLLVTVAQAVWLIGVFTVASIASAWVAFRGLHSLTQAAGLVPSILLAPLLMVLAIAFYVPLSLLCAVAVKRLLVGRYRPLRAPVWSGFHLRHWIVQQAVRLVPWPLLTGTVLQVVALRALGARIGQRVHIHRDVDLQQGGWDLLEIGDDVTLAQSAAVRLVELDAGEIIIGPVVLGAGSTLDTRAGVAGHTVLEAGAYLTALSSLPAGARIPRDECWDGIPAQPVGPAPLPSALTQPAQEWAPWQQGIMLSLTRAVVALLLVVPFEVGTILACRAFDLSAEQVEAWIFHGAAGWKPWLVTLGLQLLLMPLTLAWMALVTRLLGRVPTGTISRWSGAYVRVWLKPGLVEGAGEWLSGTLFWPLWLRWAGMKIGRGCEISTILDVVPELIEIGPETFLADGVYLGGPRIQQGRVTLARTRLDANTFLGNHVVVAAGQQLQGNILLGIATAANDQIVRAGSSWFGHPPFELPRREVVAIDRRLTHEPSAIRYGTRLFWEALRFALPVLPFLVLVAWCRILAGAAAAFSVTAFLTVAVPAVTFGAVACLCLFVVALKWTLLGKVQPGQHALWSCWCSRWDFLYVAWGKYGRGALEMLGGTLLLHWYLRAMGMKIGKRVLLGPGFAQVVDPDMIEIGDGATVNAMFQAHTFEDRVLKLGRLVIGPHATLGSATVPLYGAHIGAGTHVAAHSVIMKGEHLLPGLRYEGAPTANSIA